MTNKDPSETGAKAAEVFENTAKLAETFAKTADVKKGHENAQSAGVSVAKSKAATFSGKPGSSASTAAAKKPKSPS